MSIKTCLYVLIFISSSFSLSIHVRSPIASLFPIGHYPRFNWNSFLMPLIRSPPPPLLSPMKTSNKFLPSHSQSALSSISGKRKPIMEIGPLNEFKDWSTRAGYNGESPNHPLVPFSGFTKSHLVVPDFVRQESKRGDKILLKKIFDRGLRSMIQMDERPIRHDVMEFEATPTSDMKEKQHDDSIVFKDLLFGNGNFPLEEKGQHLRAHHLRMI